MQTMVRVALRGTVEGKAEESKAFIEMANVLPIFFFRGVGSSCIIVNEKVVEQNGVDPVQENDDVCGDEIYANSVVGVVLLEDGKDDLFIVDNVRDKVALTAAGVGKVAGIVSSNVAVVSRACIYLLETVIVVENGAILFQDLFPYIITMADGGVGALGRDVLVPFHRVLVLAVVVIRPVLQEASKQTNANERIVKDVLDA